MTIEELNNSKLPKYNFLLSIYRVREDEKCPTIGELDESFNQEKSIWGKSQEDIERENIIINRINKLKQLGI